MRTTIRGLCLAAASGAAATAQDNAAADIAPGVYVWTAGDSGCGTLTVESGDMAYVWDSGCDGSVDYRGRNVWSRGAIINIDAARYELRSVSPERLEGRWTLNDWSGDVTFERR